jgi:predicted nucleotidyltransferase
MGGGFGGWFRGDVVVPAGVNSDIGSRGDSGGVSPEFRNRHQTTLSSPGRKERIMALEALFGEKRQDVLRIAGSYGARRVRVFGSVARGEADAQSDVDFLVELDPGRSLLDLGGLQFELEALLGRPVDVVTERGLKARIRERVLREAVPV